MRVSLTYLSHAKINLYLDIRDQRPDGYHNIETIFQTVSLADELTFTQKEKRIALTCSMPELECGEGNLIVCAANLLREQSGCQQGVHITLEKRIPIAAGLAGGSGNAAATLVALNRLWKLDFSLQKLHALGAALGADVPYCIQGGTVAATERGDVLTPLMPLPTTWFVLVHPEVAVSTSAVYNGPRLGHSAEKPSGGKTAAFRAALRTLDAGNITNIIFNRMEAPVFAKHPQLARIKAQLLELGCSAAVMSGSGATVFGVCDSQQHAGQIAGAIDAIRTSVVCSVPDGVECIR